MVKTILRPLLETSRIKHSPPTSSKFNDGLMPTSRKRGPRKKLEYIRVHQYIVNLILSLNYRAFAKVGLNSIREPVVEASNLKHVLIIHVRSFWYSPSIRVVMTPGKNQLLKKGR